MAGLGLNLGLGDVQSLKNVLEKAAFNGSKLNDLYYLHEYERERLRTNIPIMLGVHGLQRIYITNSIIPVLVRSIGVKFTQKMAPLKVAIFSSSL